MFHARPHLETHSRAEAHSAVAGAAYRLGLKLYDRRLKRAFDFRKRVAGDEIVFQITVAPDGAPAWATDPLELWNRVELAERRKDAQVARDYRVPIPLGLDDSAVAAFASDMARYLARQLTTPVSVGVHRDAPITAFGVAKTPEQIGCHAHLYFPTRRVLLDDAATESEAKGGSGMGEKLSFLSNKSTSGYFVEETNRVWAELANTYCRRAGLPTDFDHRSSRRMGLKVRPQPQLGAAATALERAKVPTRKGQAVREAAAMAEIYKRAHAARMRQGATPLFMPPQPGAAKSGYIEFSPLKASADAVADRMAASTASARAQAGANGPPPSLTERFRTLYFAGLEEGSRPEETLVFRLVRAIEWLLTRMTRLAAQNHELRQETAAAATARLDALADLDAWKAGPAAHDDDDQPPKTAWSRVVDGVGQWWDSNQTATQRERAESDARTEQQLHARVVSTEQRVQDLQNERKPVLDQAKHDKAKLRRALRDLRDAHEAALPQLLAVSLAEEREWIEAYMPELLGPTQEIEDDEGGRARLPRPKVTPRSPTSYGTGGRA
ncbi:MobA/MobL family protein [Luteibacter sp. 9133]|uniref:MobA/MobL family protein n=1 Tax=Luteibacter sp. 9133 TaxID=1500891 RepID=UPI0005B9BBA2|nr:MobA/MobL family protein [Luteibacter sp. 9133]